MLDGHWPDHECRYCKNMEDIGGYSDRILQLEKLEDPGLVPPELWSDPTALSVTPTMLEVYFQNTCNMKCVYCRPDQSSQWEQELRKFGPMQTRSFKIPEVAPKNIYQKRLQDFWKWLEKNYFHLRRYQILGGEPFLLDETEQSLDFWNEHPNPNLTVSMFSNLNIDVDRFNRLLDKMEKLISNNRIYQFQIVVSIDCWGEQAEYVRSGLDWQVWKNNFEKLISFPWLDISVNSAVTALTIKTMLPLLQYLERCDLQRLDRGQRPIHRSYNLSGVSGSPEHCFDNPKMIGSGVFEKDFEDIVLFLKKSSIPRPYEISHLETMKNEISITPFNAAIIPKLISYLDELDQRRQTSWRQLFPWLEDLQCSLSTKSV